MPEFSGHNLTCIRGERIVFTGLDFKAGAGDALVLRGANGSGKSSLLRLMAGLLRAETGALSWSGGPITEDADAHRGRVHYIGHKNAIKGVLTVAENIAFWIDLRGGGGMVDQALAAFSIAHLADLPARYLSAGQLRRLALARLIARPAPLWLLDEPAAALDEDGARALDLEIAKHREKGGIAVIATHETFPGDANTLDLGMYADAARQRTFAEPAR